MAGPRRVRFYPNSGLNDETLTRAVEASRRFAVVFDASVIRLKPREQTRTTVNDPRREAPILVGFPAESCAHNGLVAGSSPAGPAKKSGLSHPPGSLNFDYTTRLLGWCDQ